MLVIDRERDVAILVRQWRAGLLGAGGDPYLLEACAGIIDPGETPEEAARREAEEEIGVTVGELRSLGTIVPSAGTLTERMHLYVAEVSAAELARAAAAAIRTKGRTSRWSKCRFPSSYEMARQGAIEDAKTLVIVQRLMLEELDAAGSR